MSTDFSIVKKTRSNHLTKFKLMSLGIILSLVIPTLSIGFNFISTNSSAQIPEEEQTISTIVTWENADRIIKGTITIAPGGTLNINKGLAIKFDGPYTIFVDGTLNINGTGVNPVILKPNISNPPPGFWGGIRINSTGGGRIRYAQISHATNGVYLHQTQNYTIRSTSVKYCSMTGVVCNASNNITLTNNSFSENTQNGLELLSAENTTIKYNTLNANWGGIYSNLSKNNYIANNSFSNRIQNTYDDDRKDVNTWMGNYYGDYTGVDTDGDYIGNGQDYGIGGDGFNRDQKPKTKIFIFNDKNINTFATLTKAVESSTASMTIAVPADTPNAGTQTLNESGYYYDNIVIDAGIGHDVIIVGQGADKVILDGNSGIGIEVDGNFKLLLEGIAIKNCDIGLYLHNGAQNCSLENLLVKNNVNGTVLNNAVDITIFGSTFDENYGAAGLVIDNCKRINVLGNNFTSNNVGDGIYIYNSNRNIISNNSCTSNLMAGVKLNQSSNNSINNCYLSYNSGAGLILLGGSNYNSFSNNKYENNHNGTELYNSKFNEFVQSKIRANPNIGIVFEANSNNNTFKFIGSNDFEGSPFAIVSNASTNNLFQNSTIAISNDITLWLDSGSSITFLNCVLNENPIKVLIHDDFSTMTIKYYLTIKTVNKTNIPIPDSYVEVYDNKTTLITRGYTNSIGELQLIPCISYIRTKTTNDFSSNNHIIIANDSISTLTHYVNMTDNIVNQFIFNYTPILIGKDNLTAIEKQYYSSSYDVLNLERDKNVTWELKTINSLWLKLDEKNRTIFGIPHNRDVGDSWVSVIVRDTDNDKALHYFKLTVFNSKPEIITKNKISVLEDEFYYVDYNSTDDDGYLNETGVMIFPEQNLTSWYHYTNATWLMFDNETGILQGTPRNNHVGNFLVNVFVDDGHDGKNTASFRVDVINTPPEIITDDILVAHKNMMYFNDYNSSDDGQGKITWKLNTNAEWLNIDNTTGVLNGTPGLTDVGDWEIDIIVSDNHGGKTNRSFTLNVIDLNLPPKIITGNVVTAYTNKLYSVQYQAEDPDTPIANITWELSIDSNAEWLSMDPETGILSGTPTVDDVGWYWVNVTALDNEGGRAFTKFKLTVLLSPNLPPTIIPETLLSDEVTVLVFSNWSHTFQAEDDYPPDGKLIWSLKTNASWLSINSTSGKIFGRPTIEDLGIYWVNVSVIDEEGLINYTNFTLIIKHKNQAPHLSNAGLNPVNGTVDTSFTFYVIYTDADNHSGEVRVYIDGIPHVMTPDPKYHSRYFKGVNFTYKTKLKQGNHTYYFQAQDEWGLEAIYDEGVPTKNSPATTNDIKKVTTRYFYEDPMCWITGIIIIIILLCVLQFVMKPLSKKYKKLEFVNKITLPDRINPVVIIQERRESEEKGEFGFLCPNCRALVPEDATKCDNCNEKFTVVEYLCPACDEIVASDDVFCPKCGSKFEELAEKDLEIEEDELVEEEEPLKEIGEAEEESSKEETPEEEVELEEAELEESEEDIISKSMEPETPVKSKKFPGRFTKALFASKVTKSLKKDKEKVTKGKEKEILEKKDKHKTHKIHEKKKNQAKTEHSKEK